MTFDCEHCGLPIHSVSAVVNGKVIHHRCKEAYEEKRKIMSEMLDGLSGLITNEEILEKYSCCK